jgi:mono/diheme cytochrome c family protein
MIRGALLPVVFAVAVAAGGAERKWTAPEADQARVNPVEATSAVLLKGQALYQKHCASCHGDKGKGDGPAESYEVEPATDLTDAALQERLTDGEILWKMTTGLRSGTDVIMPGIAKRVPVEEDRWKLVRFVRTLKDKSP